MSTRGFYAFYYNNKYYIIWNQFDSYLSGLGAAIIKEIKEAIADGTFSDGNECKVGVILHEVFTFMPSVIVDMIMEYTSSVASGRGWVHLLLKATVLDEGKMDEKLLNIEEKCVFSPRKTLESGFIFVTSGVEVEESDSTFGGDVEYGYVINFDTEQLEIYIKSRDFDFPDMCFDFAALPIFREKRNIRFPR